MVPDATDIVQCGPVWVSPGQMCELRVDGRPVRLSVLRLELLAKLISAGGRWLSREELAGKHSTRSVDAHIFWIRRALGPYRKHLVSVRGRGYRLDVVALAQEA